MAGFRVTSRGITEERPAPVGMTISAVAFNVTSPAFGAVAGTDCSAAFQAAGNAAIAASKSGVDAYLYVPQAAQAYQLKNVSFGSSGSGNGRRVRLISDGATITPVTGNTTDPMLTVSGNGDASDDWFEMRGFEVECPASRPLANPLIQLGFIRNLYVKVRADVSSVACTVFSCESSYQGHFECDMRTGKWAVPFEFTNAQNTPSLGAIAQCDTYRFDGTVITGCIGPIFRNAGNEVHGIDLGNLKVVQTVQYPVNPSTETTLNGAHSAAATSLTVTSGTGIVANDVLCVGMDGGGAGESMDVVRVSSVAGTTVNLDAATPLRFAHPTGAAVLVGGIAFSAGDGIHNIRHAGHFEGHQVGMGLGSVSSIVGENVYNGAGTYIRVNGNVAKLRIHGYTAFGTSVANTLLRRSTQNTLNADGDWVARGVYLPASRFAFTGFPHGTKNWVLEQTSSAQINETSNAQTGQGAAQRYTTQINGTGGLTGFWTYGGQGVFKDGVATRVGNTTGLTSAQIDALFTTVPPDGAILVDTTNQIYLQRSGGKWYKSAALTLIA